MSDSELEKAIAEFVGAMEVVFRLDWKYTRTMIGDEEEEATFLAPGLEDESEDWGARGVLLEKYRALLEVMKTRGIDPKLPTVWANLQMINAIEAKKAPNQSPDPTRFARGSS